MRTSDSQQSSSGLYRESRCCACPETKSARDDCFLRNDSDAADEACKDLVRKHVECMRGYGFKI